MVKKNLPGREETVKKVLIVDDELDMRIFLSTLLQGGGYMTFCACDCKEGLEKCLEIQPDLIILEVMTDGEEGIQLYYNLRKDQNLGRIPIMVLSTIDKRTFSYYQKLKKLFLEKKKLEPDAYLEKPPEAEELLQWASRLSGAGPDIPGGKIPGPAGGTSFLT